jgi:hypothetical protein
VEKVAPNFGLILSFKTLPKVINHLMGEDSTNGVTLLQGSQNGQLFLFDLFSQDLIVSMLSRAMDLGCTSDQGLPDDFCTIYQKWKYMYQKTTKDT